MSIDWRKKELEFETPEGTATYVNTGTMVYRRDKRKEVTIGKRITWAADGIEEIPRNATCARCDRRVFVCTSLPINADSEMGTRVAHFVKTSASEPSKPAYFFITDRRALCLPLASPPASSPARRAETSLSMSLPSVFSKVLAISSMTSGPVSVFPWHE